MPPVWIDTLPQLNNLLESLMKETVVAVDTESDSLYSYFEKVCLIQFSTSTTDYLVDPLNVDVSCLGVFFEDEGIQKIFHAVEYDLFGLKRDYNFSINNLFDTMIAARMLGWQRFGLATILDDQFEIKLNKRFQKYNWGERPIKQEALDYARMDTHYLLSLRKIQLKQLKQRKLFTEVMDAFQRATLAEQTPKIFNPDDFWRLKGTKNLLPQEQAVLRELFILRDSIARQLDRPPFKVMNNALLFRLIKHPPHNLKELNSIKGVDERIFYQNGEDIIKAIQVGQNVHPPSYPKNDNHRPKPEVVFRYENLRHWRNEFASSRGIAPDVIIDNHALMVIARQNPKTVRSLVKSGALTEWQIQKYGEELLKILKT
jgi:ribonuclease D